MINERTVRSGTGTVRAQSPRVSGERTRTPEVTDSVRTRSGLRDRLTDRQTRATERPGVTAPAVAVQRSVAETRSRHRDLNARLIEHRQRHVSPVDPDTPRVGIGSTRRHLISSHRPTFLHAKYYDRPDLIRHDYRRTHSYFDRHHRLHHRVIWPSYYYPVHYRFGHRHLFRHVYPYYHRKYVFISLGGWWPYDYPYMRYYWYGWHPYVWYGYYPIAYEVPSASYNYYTYNYYGQSGDGGYTTYSSGAPLQSEVQPVDHTTWADVREKLEQQNAEPAQQTLADTRFEEGVRSFESGSYDAAAAKFEEAMRLSPDDMILPFAYSQALFANGRYTEAADVLRKALSKASPEKEGVFYPRGLYSEDEVLFAQVEKLVDKLDQFGYDPDLQLLLGYHLLGLSETDHAREPLERAAQDPKNAEPAKVLLRLLEKIESETQAAVKAGDVTVESADPSSDSDSEAKVEIGPAPEPPAAPDDARPSGIPVAPKVQPQNPPDSDNVEGANGPGQSDAAEATRPEPSARQTDGAAPAVAPPGNTDPPDGDAKSPGGVSAALTDSRFSMLAGVNRYLRTDFLVFAGIVLLAWSGIYVEVKLLDRA